MILSDSPTTALESDNPVVASAIYALQKTNLVQINPEGVNDAATYINEQMLSLSYSPRTWRDHELHILPPEPYDAQNPETRKCLDWLFLISSLNFSFWSQCGKEERYAVRWRNGWLGPTCEAKKDFTGYWSLVAALDKALDEGIPITTPDFYSSSTKCPDSEIINVFRPATASIETIPLLQERIEIMREVGTILVERFGGSFQNLLSIFQSSHDGKGTALDLVKFVTKQFPSYRDEIALDGQKVAFWKRAQILVAETWAAFHPISPNQPHPLFPAGAQIHQLTMFADYRVPQLLHHLRILVYPPSLLEKLNNRAMIESGSQEEVSIRAASIVAVERVRAVMIKLREGTPQENEKVSSVLIDFYLWDLAKGIENGDDKVEGVHTTLIVPAHRTRSVWY